MFRNALILATVLIGGFCVLTGAVSARTSDCGCRCLDNGSSSELELRQLLDEFLDGASSNDASIHERFWHEDLVYTSSAGERFGKRAIMDGLSEADAEQASPPHYSAADVSIRVLGQTAVVTFRLLAEQEETLVGEYFNSGVFQCTESSWRAVTWQATRAKAR